MRTIQIDSERGDSGLPQEVETALEANLPAGERVVWYGGPVVESAVEQQSRTGWQRAAILGGGYSVVGGCVALWITGDLRWLALPLIVLAVCAVGLFFDHRRNVRVADVLTHTVYVLTARRAMVVQTQPTVQSRTIALQGVQLHSIRGETPGVQDLIFQAEDGQHLVFSDIADAATVEELVDRLKEAPEVFERQADLLAQWAEIAKQVR